MQAEINAIEQNKTWQLTKLPASHKAVRLKWVFKLKRDVDGNIVKHKSCLVVKGYLQQQGVDCDDVFPG